MVSDLFWDELLLLGLLWLCIVLYDVWSSGRAGGGPTRAQPSLPTRKRSRDPKPVAGLTHKPYCDACEHVAEPGREPPSTPPSRMAFTRGRRRDVDTSAHFCPHPNCSYQGWVGLGNLRANGHPGGGPWRQLQCLAGGSYFQETHGTPLHGKHVPLEMLVWAVGALAEGLGIRAVARVFEVDPNTVLTWLSEVADHAAAFSRHFLHDVRVTQVQLDELFALLSAVKAEEVSEPKIIQRLSRSPRWVWGALDPVTKLLLTIDVGERTLAMAQGVVHQVMQIVAPGCLPLFLTDGFKEYTTGLMTHYGQWVQPARRRVLGPLPKPRWMPLPGLLYAQVVKQYRRRCLVGMHHRVVFGTLEGVKQVLASTGWQINTAFIERVNLSIRQHVAAVGRRVTTLCKGKEGVRHQLALYHGYYNFCLPHASLRRPLPQPLPTYGMGSARRWQPCTPAMAAGLTDHVWSLKEVLLFRVPPWPQPQAL
jgi:IS1 family transposase